LFDPDFHDALVHAEVGPIAVGAGAITITITITITTSATIMSQLKDMGFQAAVLGDNIRDGTKVDHSLTQ